MVLAPGGHPPVRMVASDIDGTLIPRDGVVSARTLAAFAACRRAGIEVIAVTGRPPRWLAELGELVGTGLAVCANGALVYDLERRVVVRAHVLERAAVLDAAAVLRAALPGVALAVETLSGFRRTPEYVPRFDSHRITPPADLAALLADDPGVVKLLVRVDDLDADALLAAVVPVLSHLGRASHSGVLGGLVEVAPPGVSKAATLARLAAERGIDPSEVAAFGDMPNDLDMLAWAGQSYAMADGHPDVIAAASAVAPACAEDGVAQVLELILRRDAALPS